MRTTYLLLTLVSLTPSLSQAQMAAGEGVATAKYEIQILPPVDPLQLSQPESVEAIPPGAVQDRPASMGLADLEAIALAENPSLVQAAARVEAARGDWVQAGLLPNPVAGYSASEVGNEGRGGQQGGFVGQEIITAGKLRLSRGVAAQEIKVAEAQFMSQRLRVLSDVRINFYEVMIAQRRVDISRELVGVSQRASDTAKSFLEREEGNRVDLLQARVEASSARILLENSQNDYLASWRRLSAVIGAPMMEAVPLTGDLEADLPELSFDEAMGQLFAGSPELAAAQSGVTRARVAVDRAYAGRIPNVDLQGSVQHDNVTHNEIANVQVGLPLPFWNRNQGGIRRAHAELAEAQGDVQRVELSLQQRLATAYQRYANARQQVDTYKRDILPDAQSSLDLVTNGYKQGEFGFLTLLTSQRTFFQTNLAYLESLRQLRESRAAIDGMLLSDSLRGDETTRWR